MALLIDLVGEITQRFPGSDSDIDVQSFTPGIVYFDNRS